MKILTFIPLALLISLFSTSALAAGEMEAHDPWVREAPPMADIMASYLLLHNHTNQTRTLEHVTSPQFKQVEIHRSEMKNGMANMVPVSRVIITSQGSVGFQPNGLHLMLIGPKNPTHAGDSVQLTLHFTDGYTLVIDAPVKKLDDMDDTRHSDQDHHH